MQDTPDGQRTARARINLSQGMVAWLPEMAQGKQGRQDEVAEARPGTGANGHWTTATAEVSLVEERTEENGPRSGSDGCSTTTDTLVVTVSAEQPAAPPTALPAPPVSNSRLGASLAALASRLANSYNKLCAIDDLLFIGNGSVSSNRALLTEHNILAIVNGVWPLRQGGRPGHTVAHACWARSVRKQLCSHANDAQPFPGDHRLLAVGRYHSESQLDTSLNAVPAI